MNRRVHRRLNRQLVRLLLALYPPAWRDRYGAEVVRLTEELIAAGETTPARGALNLASAAVLERGRALADSRRAAAAMAVAALIAVAGSFYLTAPVRPPGPAAASSALSPPARLVRVACVTRQPTAASPLSASAGRAEIRTKLRAEGRAAQFSHVLLPVRILLPHGKTIRGQCVMLPAICHPGLAKGHPGLATSPGVTVKPGQCVIAAPELSRRMLILPGW